MGRPYFTARNITLSSERRKRPTGCAKLMWHFWFLFIIVNLMKSMGYNFVNIWITCLFVCLFFFTTSVDILSAICFGIVHHNFPFVVKMFVDNYAFGRRLFLREKIRDNCVQLSDEHKLKTQWTQKYSCMEKKNIYIYLMCFVMYQVTLAQPFQRISKIS